jgi:hypothetical protein
MEAYSVLHTLLHDAARKGDNFIVAPSRQFWNTLAFALMWAPCSTQALPASDLGHEAMRIPFASVGSAPLIAGTATVPRCIMEVRRGTVAYPVPWFLSPPSRSCRIDLEGSGCLQLFLWFSLWLSLVGSEVQP